MLHYYVIKTTTREDLIKAVCRYLKAGWNLQGAVSYTTTVNTHYNEREGYTEQVINEIFIQAMTRNIEETKE